MSYPHSQERIEKILVQLKRDILILSIKKHTLTENVSHIIQTLDQHLPGMVQKVRLIYADGFNIVKAEEFYHDLRVLLDETLGIARLDEVIENEETDMVSHVKNQFVEITREVQKTLHESKK